MEGGVEPCGPDDVSHLAPGSQVVLRDFNSYLNLTPPSSSDGGNLYDILSFIIMVFMFLDSFRLMGVTLDLEFW